MKLSYAEKERIAFVTGRNYPLFAALADAELANGSRVDAVINIQEAKTGFPNEDFLQEFISDLQDLAKGRVTKADVLGLAVRLEELQLEIARQAEYGLDELRKAEDSLEAA